LKRKAISLFSGGLDSILSAAVITRQGIDVMGVAFETPFFNAQKALTAARRIDLPLTVMNITPVFLKMLHKPRYGFGRNMNPCIDCHTMMLNLAGQKMLNDGADFIITGEVLGQRPMSQTKQSLYIVAKNSGFQDYILRPLSARLLPETKAEREGKIDRDSLYAIQGRGRHDQLKMAKEFDITDFAAPAGGCLLTDPMFSRRLKDLFGHQPDAVVKDIELLKHGRHFRIDPDSKAIVGRNKMDNIAIEELCSATDILFHVENFPGPATILVGKASEDNMRIAASLCLIYSDAPKDKPNRVRWSMGDKNGYVDVVETGKEDFRRWMI
jgi:tRNA U34 2-thiouridine synthase MnmA/TrmU